MAFAAKESEPVRNSQGARRLAKAIALDRAWKAAQSWQSLFESIRVVPWGLLRYSFSLYVSLCRFVADLSCWCGLCSLYLCWPFGDFGVFFFCYLIATCRVNFPFCHAVMLQILFGRPPTIQIRCCW